MGAITVVKFITTPNISAPNMPSSAHSRIYLLVSPPDACYFSSTAQIRHCPDKCLSQQEGDYNGRQFVSGIIWTEIKWKLYVTHPALADFTFGA